MKDILYLDRGRFDQYSAQAAPSLATIEKIKKLGAEFSITGPKVSFGQEERVRALTDFEKMDVIVAALKKEGDLRTTRPETEDEGPAFVIERCDAIKVVVPYALRGDDHKTPEIVLWFAAPVENSPSATLCLVEDYRGEDSRPVTFQGASTYTLLQSLVHYTRSNDLATVRDAHIAGNHSRRPTRSKA